MLLKNSRDHERDADQYAARKLVEAGISNKAIRQFFERIAREHKKERKNIPDFILTHPADAERIHFFEKYETRHKGRLKTAAAEQEEELASMLKRKPEISAECIASQPAKDKKKPGEEEEE